MCAHVPPPPPLVFPQLLNNVSVMTRPSGTVMTDVCVTIVEARAALLSPTDQPCHSPATTYDTTVISCVTSACLLQKHDHMSLWFLFLSLLALLQWNTVAIYIVRPKDSSRNQFMDDCEMYKLWKSVTYGDAQAVTMTHYQLLWICELHSIYVYAEAMIYCGLQSLYTSCNNEALSVIGIFTASPEAVTMNH